MMAWCDGHCLSIEISLFAGHHIHDDEFEHQAIFL
jgi:hypothetical protein